MNYCFYLLTLLGIYGAVTVSLVLVVEDAGLVSVAHAAVLGTGAYASALLQMHADMSSIAGIACGAVAGSSLMIVLSFIAAMMTRDGFILATVALQVAFSALVQNLADVTGGGAGLRVPQLSAFGRTLEPGKDVAFAAFALAGISVAIVGTVRAGTFMHAVHCVRDAELFSRSLGLSPTWYRAFPMAVAGAITGAAGGLLAGVLMFVDPSSYSLTDSCVLLAMVAFGGGRSLVAALCGTAVIIGVPEVLRFIGISGTVAGNIRQIISATVIAIAAIRALRDKNRETEIDRA